MKHIMIIDDVPRVLKFVKDLFQKYVEGKKTITPFLYYKDDREMKEFGLSDKFDKIDVVGVVNLLSDSFINQVREKMEKDPNCWVLIDIQLDQETSHKSMSYRECESVKFAEKLVDDKVVKKSHLFFYSLSPSLPPIRSQFREDTRNRQWNEPLPRPVIYDGMSNEREKKAFVARVMNPIEYANVDGVDKC